MRHFISIADYSSQELRHTLEVSKRLKNQLKTTGRNDPMLAGKTLALVFEKPSLRTRVSFAVAMTQLGGNGLLLRDEEVGLDKREPTPDVARVLSGMCDGIMARTFEHSKIERLAEFSTVPVIRRPPDGLFPHPCQAMADFLTVLRNISARLTARRLPSSAMAITLPRSLAVACGKFGMRFILAAPGGYELPAADIDRIMSQVPQLDFVTTHDPEEASRAADVLYTDTWVSMGQEAEKQQRVQDFKGFCIDEKLLSLAPLRRTRW